MAPPPPGQASVYGALFSGIEYLDFQVTQGVGCACDCCSWMWACQGVCSACACNRSLLGYCHRFAPRAGSVFLHASYCGSSTIPAQQWPKAPRPKQPTTKCVGGWRTGWSRRETVWQRASTPAPAMSGRPRTAATPPRRRWGPGWDGSDGLVKPGKASTLWTRDTEGCCYIPVIMIKSCGVRVGQLTESCCWQQSHSMLSSSSDVSRLLYKVNAELHFFFFKSPL